MHIDEAGNHQLICTVDRPIRNKVGDFLSDADDLVLFNINIGRSYRKAFSLGEKHLRRFNFDFHGFLLILSFIFSYSRIFQISVFCAFIRRLCEFF